MHSTHNHKPKQSAFNRTYRLHSLTREITAKHDFGPAHEQARFNACIGFIGKSGQDGPDRWYNGWGLIHKVYLVDHKPQNKEKKLKLCLKPDRLAAVSSKKCFWKYNTPLQIKKVYNTPKAYFFEYARKSYECSLFFIKSPLKEYNDNSSSCRIFIPFLYKMPSNLFCNIQKLQERFKSLCLINANNVNEISKLSFLLHRRILMNASTKCHNLAIRDFNMHFLFTRNKNKNKLEKTQNLKWINRDNKYGLQNSVQQALRFKLRIGKICRYHKTKLKQPRSTLRPTWSLHKKWPLIYFGSLRDNIETLSTKSPSIGCLLTFYNIDFNQWILQQIAITKNLRLPLI